MREKTGPFWKLITIAAVLFLMTSGIWFLFASTSESKRLEQDLIDRHGWATEFVPAADGSIPLDRLERFLRVRRAVQPACRDYQAVLDGIVGLEAIDDDPEISGEESASRAIRGVKSMFKVGPRMLNFMDARNNALLAEDMGLGEYIYIYLSAYAEQLANVTSSPYVEMDEAHVGERAREEFIRILENQLSALGSDGSQAGRSDLTSRIDALQKMPGDATWPAESSPNTRLSLAPYRDRLSGLYCDGLAGLELQQKNRGFDFDG